jgi:hypothetical protein
MHLAKPNWRRAAVAALAAAGVMAAAGCTSSSTTGSTGKPVKGGTVTMGLLAGTQPNYIFPFRALTYFRVYNAQYFQYLMYRPLYVFGDNGTSVTVNYPLSPADAPVYSNGGKTVVINLKGWKWSNGETMDAKDVVFWLHMMYPEFANWGGATPGGIPTNISSISITGAEQVTLNLTRAYSSLWYTYNELSQITPMPMAWDVTKAGAAPGSGGCTADSAADHWAKCKAVYNFLAAQSKDVTAYATSPIWSVVDGPLASASYNLNPTTGSVPALPANKWTPAVQKGSGPYPFSISTAKSLLTSHGWSELGGVMTCTDPAKCGSGVAKGVKLNLNIVYTSGNATFTDEMAVYKSDAAMAGIDLTVTPQSFNTIISETVPTNHIWQMGMYGGWSYGLAPEPTGGQLFTTGAGANGGGYSNPTMNNLITGTETSSSLSVFHDYATYAAQQLPFIYMPSDYDIMAVKSNLHDVDFNPLFWDLSGVLVLHEVNGEQWSR